MINIFPSRPNEYNGSVYRYEDFFNYLNDSHISFTVDGMDAGTNTIIDIDRIYTQDKEKNLLDRFKYRKVFIGGMGTFLDNIKTMLNRNEYVTHSLYYANKLNSCFLPMFIYKNRVSIIPTKKRYKYGIFATRFQLDYNALQRIMEDLNLRKEDVLILSRELLFKHDGYDITQDTSYFASSIDSYLDISSKGGMSQVMSRLYLELIDLDVDLNCVSFAGFLPVTFQNFRHIKYHLKTKCKDFDVFSIEYDKKYFKTASFSSYISQFLSTLRIDMRPYVEDYVD